MCMPICLASASCAAALQIEQPAHELRVTSPAPALRQNGLRHLEARYHVLRVDELEYPLQKLGLLDPNLSICVFSHGHLGAQKDSIPEKLLSFKEALSRVKCAY